MGGEIVGHQIGANTEGEKHRSERHHFEGHQRSLLVLRFLKTCYQAAIVARLWKMCHAKMRKIASEAKTLPGQISPLVRAARTPTRVQGVQGKPSLRGVVLQAKAIGTL